MAQNDMKLNVVIEPEFKKIKKVQEDLGKVVSSLGDDKITQQFNKIDTKLKSLDVLFEKTFDINAFKSFSAELKTITTEIMNMVGKVSTVDFSDLESKLDKAVEKRNALLRGMGDLKKGGKITPQGTFQFSDAEKNRQAKAAGIKRIAGLKGRGNGSVGSVIQEHKQLIGYQQKMKDQNLSNVDTYKKIEHHLNTVKKAESDRTAQIKKQAAALQEQEALINKIQADIKKRGSTPGAGKNSNLQQQIVKLQADVLGLKGQISGKIETGKQAAVERARLPETYSADSTKKADGVVGKAVKNFTSYTLVMGAMRRAYRQTIQTIRVLDNALTEQAMVSGKTKKELTGLLKTYQDIGKVAGATTKEVAEVATQYFRQGKTIKEAMILTEAAVSAAKVGAISTADSVDYLTTAINGFGMAAQDASRVSDRFSALAASSATNYEELAVALSKVAAQAHLADMSMDFTLGLLAKGIETTREAPETIGTALKTVIARMREMTDYGKTLEDGVPVNNLEKQLEYVGIALRNSNGELKSSQEVLDEVGRSWDGFNKNQQAALAKAFAGTRQQSRFIALMQDYDRTLELVSISQNSMGATAAQMATYMSGLEAAINQFNVNVEGLITTFVNSDIIIHIIDYFTNALEGLNRWFGDSEKGATRIKTVLTAIAVVTGLMATNVIASKAQQRQLNALLLKQARQEQLEEAKATLEEKKQTVEAQHQLDLEQSKAEAVIAQAQANQGNLVAAEQNLQKSKQAEQSAKSVYKTNKELLKAEQDLTKTKWEGNFFTRQLIGLLSIHQSLQKIGLFIQNKIIAKKTVELAGEKAITRENKKQLKLEAAKATLKSMFSPTALIGAAAVAGTVGLGVGIHALVKTVKQNNPEYKEKQARRNISDTNAESFKINQQITKLHSATEAYNNYENQLIKTKEAQEEVNKQLDAAAEGLSKEQKAQYDSLQTAKDRANFLIKEEERQRKAARDKAKEQVENLKRLGNLTKTLQEDPQTRIAVATIAADQISEKNEAARGLVKDLLNDADASTLTGIFNSTGNGGAIAESLAAGLLRKQGEHTIQDLLSSSKGSIAEKMQAYQTLVSSVGGSNSVAGQVLAQTYKDLESLVSQLGTSGVNFDKFEQKGFQLEDIDEIRKKLEKATGHQKEFTLQQILDLISASNPKEEIQKLIEGIENIDKDIIESLTADIILGPKNSFQQTAQSLTQLKNEAKAVYDAQEKWSTMTAEEQRTFYESHKDLFKFISVDDFAAGGDLSKALEKVNEKDIQDMKQKISDAIAVAEQEGDLAYKRMLEQQLHDIDHMYDKLLEKRVKEEEEFVKQMGNALSIQKKKVVENLNEQKKAYSDYFAAIKKTDKQEEYEEKRESLVTNILKLGAGTDATSAAKMADLEAELAKLDEAREKELKELGQQAVVENIDSQIEQTNKELDALNKSVNGIFDYIKREGAESAVEEGLQNILTDENLSGLKKGEAVNKFIQGISSYLKDAYGTTINPDSIKVVNTDGNKLVFNVNGVDKTIDLDQASQNEIFSFISNIMQSRGIG